MALTHAAFVRKRQFMAGTALAALAALSACGGSGSSGGGGGVISTPAPVASPAPPPPSAAIPASQPTNFNTSEVFRSDGPAYHGAVTAWEEGATGAGIIVGVVDSGIDIDSHEFEGRIHPDSFDATLAGRGFDEAVEDGHGTRVARVLAAARDNRDVVGVAFDATLLSLRTDTANSCATGGDDGTGACSHANSDIARAINHATDVGARVINISLGGGDGISNSLRSAVDRATKAGIVIVVAAGNQGDVDVPLYDPDNPSPFAQGLVDAGNGLVIISTSVDNQDRISAFSNLAGNEQDNVLSALGNLVCCTFEDDSIRTENRDDGSTVGFGSSGTSFSAPQISGAAALLAQAFPNLSGAEIVELLLETARDVGDAGVDGIFGNGILDIAGAFQPVGQTSLSINSSGGSSSIALNNISGSVSAAMGDAAVSGNALSAIVTDRFDRPFEVDLAPGIASRAPALRLAPALTAQSRGVRANAAGLQLAFDIREESGLAVSVTPFNLNGQGRYQAQLLAGRVSANIARNTRFSAAIRQSAAHQVSVLQGQGTGGSFIISRNALRDTGFAVRPYSAFAMRHQLGRWGITASFGAGDVDILDPEKEFRAGIDAPRQGDIENFGYSSLGLAIDRNIGPAKLSAHANWLREEHSILGANFSESFGGGGSESLFLGADLHMALGSGWAASAVWKQGLSWAEGSNLIASGSQLSSNAFSFELGREAAFFGDDRIGLRISQPLRVVSGGLNLELPVAFDFETESSLFAVRQFNLAPRGREIASELAWTMPVYGGHFSANAFWRQEPGHFENLPDDVGVAFRLNFGF